jgi:hypothetical protein
MIVSDYGAEITALRSLYDNGSPPVPARPLRL